MTDPNRLEGLAARAALEEESREVMLVAVGAPTGQDSFQRPPMRLIPGTLGTNSLNWQSFTETTEFVPALKWPQSILTYEQMRTDSQLSSLYRAMTMPIKRFKWLIEPNGARPAVVNGLADDLNLDIVGAEPRPRGRQKNRFSFSVHLHEALLALIYGHRYFETIGEIVPAQRFPGNERWRLRKLSVIPSETIDRVNVAADGGLVSIVQRYNYGTAYQPIPIPVGSMIAYPWDKEGPNWLGRSIMRDCYKDWLIKDRLVRVDAINHERAGGIHIAKGPPGATPTELAKLSQMASAAAVVEEGGGAVPYGAEYEIHKAGAGTDVINSVRYHDESMARLFLHMFLQLGQTQTGSRALGDVFVEYAYIAQKSVANWFRDITNAHLLEDWVDWNWSDSEQAPLLTYIVEEETDYIPVEDLINLINAGVITVDDELEESLRTRFKLPDRAEGSTPRNLTPAEASAWLRVREEARREAGEQYENTNRRVSAGSPVDRRNFFRALVGQ